MDLKPATHQAHPLAMPHLLLLQGMLNISETMLETDLHPK
jgi:hypothetical protein